MKLKQTRLVTTNVDRLTAFYEGLTGAEATVFSSGYVEFQRSPVAGLAITDAAVIQAYGSDVATAGDNKSAILDFEVEDVDAEYERIKDKAGDWVQAPTLMPWGNRAMMLRDPDGNLINVFAARASDDPDA